MLQKPISSHADIEKHLFNFVAAATGEFSRATLFSFVPIRIEKWQMPGNSLQPESNWRSVQLWLQQQYIIS